MSPTVAFAILTWAAIVVLYLGLAATLREVRLLRGTVLRNPGGYAAGQPDIRLGEAFTGPHPGGRVVVAADSGCPMCLAVIELLALRKVPAELLTHEPPEVWTRIAGPLRVVSDRDSWRAVAHLAPPVLMLVDGGGTVRRLQLPVRVEEVDDVLADWIGDRQC